MLIALILIVAVAGIVILARRWPDVEAKLWPDEVDVPEREARSGSAVDTASTEPVAAAAEVEETPAVEKTAGGLMSKKAISTEPEVDATEVNPITVGAQSDDVSAPEPDEDTAQEPESFLDSVPDVTETVTAVEETVVTEEVVETAAAEQPSPTPAASPSRAIPKPRVMGEPARPSQPAYVDATKRVSESFEQLASEADKAWQERSYDKAEQACLKILVQQPKNHKYMTRIGQIYQETGDLEDAKEAFESAKKLDPKNFFVLNRLSEVERMITDKGGRTSAKRPVGKS